MLLPRTLSMLNGPLRLVTIVALGSSVNLLQAQYDRKTEAFDWSLTPFGGPASSPPPSTQPFDAPPFRPVTEWNRILPKWLQFGVENRVRFEGYRGNRFGPNATDSYPLNRLRIGLVLQPVTWFRIVAQTQDARAFNQKPPIGPPNTVTWDLKLAYAQFGDAEKHPVTLKVGRQVIDYNNTIIGNSEWRNQGRSYDAVVADFHVNRFRAAVFAASVVNPTLHGITHHQEGNNIYGAYGWITQVIPKSSIEPFVLWRVAPSVAVEASKSKSGRLDEKAYGLRVRGRNIADLDYRAELIAERGRAGSNRVRAWATTAAFGYTASQVAGKPRFFTGYDYASGDKHPADGTRGTFDTMYPTAHDRFGLSDQFGWQNIAAWRWGATVIPHRHWSVTGQYLNLRLASANDAVYNTSGGSLLRDTTGKYGKHLGEEFDAYTWYEINPQVRVGSGVGHLLPGSFLAKTGKAGPYTYPYFVLEFSDGKRIR